MNFNNIPRMGQDLLRAAKRAGSGGGSGSGSSSGPSRRGLAGLSALLLGGTALGVAAYHSLWTVNGGHRGVMFNRVVGVRNEVFGEGTHVRIPWFEEPTIFDIRTKPKAVRSPSGTKDLQMVDITLRVLYKPEISKLPKIFSELGTNYDERILPSIVNETLKSVIAQFNASQLITQREQVSQLIKRNLVERASHFNIVVDDVSITHLTFGQEYAEAVESKQVAQQEAERAKFLVKQALQDKRSTVIKAQGEAASAELIGAAVQANPGYLELRQLDAAKHISETIAKSNNKVYLDSDSLLLNITATSESAKRFAAASSK